MVRHEEIIKQKGYSKKFLKDYPQKKEHRKIDVSQDYKPIDKRVFYSTALKWDSDISSLICNLKNKASITYLKKDEINSEDKKKIAKLVYYVYSFCKKYVVYKGDFNPTCYFFLQFEGKDIKGKEWLKVLRNLELFARIFKTDTYCRIIIKLYKQGLSGYDLARKLGYKGKNIIQDYLKNLERLGLIKREEEKYILNEKDYPIIINNIIETLKINKKYRALF